MSRWSDEQDRGSFVFCVHVWAIIPPPLRLSVPPPYGGGLGWGSLQPDVLPSPLGEGWGGA